MFYFRLGVGLAALPCIADCITWFTDGASLLWLTLRIAALCLFYVWMFGLRRHVYRAGCQHGRNAAYDEIRTLAIQTRQNHPR